MMLQPIVILPSRVLSLSLLVQNRSTAYGCLSEGLLPLCVLKKTQVASCMHQDYNLTHWTKGFLTWTDSRGRHRVASVFLSSAEKKKNEAL